MSRFLVIFTTMLIACCVFLTEVHAVSLSPSSSSTVTANEEMNINIVSSASAAISGIQMRLGIANGEILTYTPPGGNTLAATGTGCGSMQTATDICVDIASTGSNTIPVGGSLGVMRIKIGSSGTTTITAKTGNQYTLAAGGNEPMTGNIGTYTVGGSLPGNLPNTALFDSSNQIVISVGFIALIVGEILLLSTILKMPKESIA